MKDLTDNFNTRLYDIKKLLQNEFGYYVKINKSEPDAYLLLGIILLEKAYSFDEHKKSIIDYVKKGAEALMENATTSMSEKLIYKKVLSNIDTYFSTF